MFLHFKKVCETKWLMWSLSVIGLIAVILAIFFAGVAFGHQRANFKCNFADRYENMFFGKNNNMMPGGNPRDNVRAFGATGKVLSVASSTIVVEDISGVEKVVSIDSKTEIKSAKDSILISDIKIGSNVIVIGQPSQDGSINAKLIRVTPEGFNNMGPRGLEFRAPGINATNTINK